MYKNTIDSIEALKYKETSEKSRAQKISVLVLIL